MTYVAPKRGLKSFTCPHCGVLARQYSYCQATPDLDGNNYYQSDAIIASTVCEHCNDFTLWVGEQMLHPNRGNAPVPNPDMPSDVKIDYEEAASIAHSSPKAAAALLRLAIQKLCTHLGGKGKNINEDISSLVKAGLPEKIQKSLDIVRVVGNNAVHPGQINTDDPEVVGQLFILINIIVETMITVPKKVGDLYSSLPKGALEAIEKRDAKS